MATCRTLESYSSLSVVLLVVLGQPMLACFVAIVLVAIEAGCRLAFILSCSMLLVAKSFDTGFMVRAVPLPLVYI